MRILYVTARPIEINSSASLRNLNTINGLYLLGNEVTVLSVEANKNHPNYVETRYVSDKIHTIAIGSSATKKIAASFSKHNFLNKIRLLISKIYAKRNVYDSTLSCVKNFKLSVIDATKFDIMISSSDPKTSHLLAEKIFDEKKLKWVQIWGDPFTGDITSIGQNESKKASEEKRFLSKGTKIFYLSPLVSNEMKHKYNIFQDKIFFMPRPYVNPMISNKKCHNHDISISYCGDYNSKVRNILPLYNAISKSRYHLTIVGNSNFSLEPKNNIVIDSRKDKKDVDQIEDRSDVLIHLSNLGGNQIPGKIYNYSSTNKPILFILDGNKEDIYREFKKYNRYIFCDNKEDDILEKLDFISQNIEKMRFNPVPEFCYSAVLNRLVEE